jgi:hypothetical protein
MAKNKKKIFTKVIIEPSISNVSEGQQKYKLYESKRPPQLDVNDISFETNINVDLAKMEVNSELISDEITNILENKLQEQAETNDNTTLESEKNDNTTLESDKNDNTTLESDKNDNTALESKTNDNTTLESDTKENIISKVNENQEIKEINSESTNDIELKEIEIINEEKETNVKNTRCSKKWCVIL